MPIEYRTTPLFGGAICADLPSNFKDVSDFRQVPDHQEVFLDKDGFTSIIIDITERVGPAGSSDAIDGAALIIHLEEITETSQASDTLRVWSTTRAPFTHIDPSIPSYCLIATQTPKVGEKSDKAPDFTAVVLTLIRLEKENADVLVTVNVPHIRGEYNEGEIDFEEGQRGKLIEGAVDVASKIWETFKIKDWTLFDA